MCSPKQTIGAPSLLKEIDKMRAAGDRRSENNAVGLVRSVRSAKANARADQRRMLVQAGKRFDRRRTLGLELPNSATDGMVTDSALWHRLRGGR